jgi:hypothetical protein
MMMVRNVRWRKREAKRQDAVEIASAVFAAWKLFGQALVHQM